MTNRSPSYRLAFLLLCVSLIAGRAVAQAPDVATQSSSRMQQETQLPNAPHTYTPPPRQSFLDPEMYYAEVSSGVGTSFDGAVHPASGQFLASVGMSTLSQNGGFAGGQSFVEVGFIGPLANRTAAAGFVSYDLGLNMVASHQARTIFFAVVGYSYLFGESHALNYGIGFDRYISRYRAIRVEVRDYFTFTDIPQHNVALRICWQFAANNP